MVARLHRGSLSDPVQGVAVTMRSGRGRARLDRERSDLVATVNELAEPFPISVQAVSKHLQVLERAGLIDRGRTAQLRPSRLRVTPLKDAADWLEAYRRFWSASFDRLDERLQDGED